MNDTHVFNSSLVIGFVLMIIIFMKAFENGKSTCKNYILNTYLYVTFAIVLTAITVIGQNKYKWVRNPDSLIYIFSSFICLIALLFLSGNIPLSHLLWLGFIFSFSIQLSLWYKNSKKDMLKVILTTFAIVISLSVFAHFNSDFIKLSWGPVLTFSLIGIIIFQIISMFVDRDQKNTQNLISYLAIALFCFFILYDTKLIQENAKKCVKANYPVESLGLFLDIINLVLNVDQVN